MNICVAGWYFHRPFMETLQKSPHRTHIVSHREVVADVLEMGFPVSVSHNIGLEFNCYNWFLMNHWTGGDTLFTHDDNEITPDALEEISHLAVDQAFLFGSQAEAEANGNAHGRAFFCSAKLLERIKQDGGFWYDEGIRPEGDIPATTAEVPDFHNQGIQVFRSYLESLEPWLAVNRVAIIPGLKTGYRGRL